MRKGKRVTGSLGLLLAAVLGLTTAACNPDMDPNQPGPPAVVKVLAFNVDDATINSTLWVTDDPAIMSNCDFDYDGGTGAMEATIGATWAFRIVLSELIDGDEVEPLNDGGVGEYAYPGFVQITDTTGGTITSDLDPTLQLTPDMLWSMYQPAGGNGCYDTVESIDISGYTPIPGPAIQAFLDGVPSLPSNSTLTLWLKTSDGAGHQVVDTSGEAMASDFRVDFSTEPMLVDCPSIDMCNTLPYVDAASQPQDPADEDVGFDMISVQFNTPIGDPSGLYLFEVGATETTQVTDALPFVDSEVLGSLWGEMDSAVSLVAGIDEENETYLGLEFNPDTTYWIVATDAILDLWGVPPVVTDVVDENGDPLDLCAEAEAAGVVIPTGETCIWAGSFTTAPAA